MFRVYCTGIVHGIEGVVLVRNDDKQRWRLPERAVDETEDVLVCMRRVVLAQTGFRVMNLRLYKIQTQARTAKQAPFVRFIFGCEVGGNAIQAPDAQARYFSPTELIKLADKDQFNDRTLMRLVHSFHEGLTPAQNVNPLSA